MHFNILRNLKTSLSLQQNKDESPLTTATTPLPNENIGNRTTSPSQINNQQQEKEVNISNEWRIYAKMECNYHLTNKFALFVNMSKYYKSIGRDPLDVLPLSFHIKKGNHDPTFFKFMQVFREYEDKAKESDNPESTNQLIIKKTPTILSPKQDKILSGEVTQSNGSHEDKKY